MIRHIVMWCFKEEIKEEEKEGLKQQMKEQLLALVGIVPGLLHADFVPEPIPGSTHDMALIAELESLASLQSYQEHPAHVQVANTYVRPYVCNRSCLDYEVR